MDDQPLQQMSTQILMDVKEWRRAHPRATYVEREDEVHQRMMYLEAQLMQTAVSESPSREWGRGSEADAVLCPHRDDSPIYGLLIHLLLSLKYVPGDGIKPTFLFGKLQNHGTFLRSRCERNQEKSQ